MSERTFARDPAAQLDLRGPGQSLGLKLRPDRLLLRRPLSYRSTSEFAQGLDEGILPAPRVFDGPLHEQHNDAGHAFPGGSPKNSASALDPLTQLLRAGDDHTKVGIRYVDPFVQRPRSHDCANMTALKTAEDTLSLRL